MTSNDKPPPKGSIGNVINYPPLDGLLGSREGRMDRGMSMIEQSMIVAALYVECRGVYFDKPDIRPYCVCMDAKGYEGPYPVIAHPPCSRWSALASLTEATHGYKVGDDGGCFKAALESVRTYGGVLEHPAQSKAYDAFGLPHPKPGEGWTHVRDDEWVCYVEQFHYGHKARKATWLFYVGHIPLPCISERADDSRIKFAITTGGVLGSKARANARGKETMDKSEHSTTPPAFREYLLRLARTQYETREIVAYDKQR